MNLYDLFVCFLLFIYPMTLFYLDVTRPVTDNKVYLYYISMPQCFIIIFIYNHSINTCTTNTQTRLLSRVSVYVAVFPSEAHWRVSLLSW